MEAPRSTAQRKADTLSRLGSDVDCWVTSASAGGEAYLIPLSYVWYGQQIIMATLTNSLTVRNLRRAGNCRVALDGTRDVILIEGPIEITPTAAISHDIATAFKSRQQASTRTNRLKIMSTYYSPRVRSAPGVRKTN